MILQDARNYGHTPLRITTGASAEGIVHRADILIERPDGYRYILSNQMVFP